MQPGIAQRRDDACGVVLRAIVDHQRFELTGVGLQRQRLQRVDYGTLFVVGRDKYADAGVAMERPAWRPLIEQKAGGEKRIHQSRHQRNTTHD